MVNNFIESYVHISKCLVKKLRFESKITIPLSKYNILRPGVGTVRPIPLARMSFFACYSCCIGTLKELTIIRFLTANCRYRIIYIYYLYCVYNVSVAIRLGYRYTHGYTFYGNNNSNACGVCFAQLKQDMRNCLEYNNNILCTLQTVGRIQWSCLACTFYY